MIPVHVVISVNEKEALLKSLLKRREALVDIIYFGSTRRGFRIVFPFKVILGSAYLRIVDHAQSIHFDVVIRVQNTILHPRFLCELLCIQLK